MYTEISTDDFFKDDDCDVRPLEEIENRVRNNLLNLDKLRMSVNGKPVIYDILEHSKHVVVLREEGSKGKKLSIAYKDLVGRV